MDKQKEVEKQEELEKQQPIPTPTTTLQPVPVTEAAVEKQQPTLTPTTTLQPVPLSKIALAFFIIFLIINIGLFLGGMLAPHIADKEEYDKRQKGVVISLLSFSTLAGISFLVYKKF